MRKLSILFSVITILLLLTAMICGLWMRGNPSVEQSSVDFHMTFGIASFVCCCLSLIFTLLTKSIKRRERR